MKELEKIYENWSLNQKDGRKTKKKWEGMHRYLYGKCLEREMLENKISDYSLEVEKQAFIAGYKQAFRLLMEVADVDSL